MRIANGVPGCGGLGGRGTLSANLRLSGSAKISVHQRSKLGIWRARMPRREEPLDQSMERFDLGRKDVGNRRLAGQHEQLAEGRIDLFPLLDFGWTKGSDQAQGHSACASRIRI